MRHVQVINTRHGGTSVKADVGRCCLCRCCEVSSSAQLLMDPFIRRRLPPSVRSLLTDIGPKEEWTDTEPDTVTRDGILLPARGAASGQEELLKPAEAESSRVCMLCKCKPSSYTCPRCNLHYCGLACYQSPDHSACSEEFYKESVLQELKEMGKTESERGGRRCRRASAVRRRERSRDRGYFDKTGRDRRGELLSEDVDEDAECAEGTSDLADRLSGLDIDKLSEEELWDLLDSEEKEKFVSLVKGGGALGGLVPLWKPWWEEHEDGGRALVEVLEEEVSKLESENSTAADEEVVQKRDESATKLKKIKGGKRRETSRSKGSSAVPGVPPVSAKIPKLSSLCANPSPLICYGLVNALYGYTFTLCLFNNDTDSLMFEFCDMILALSEALSSNRVFNSVREALDCGETLVSSGGYLDKEDPLAPTRAVEAVAHILTGRDRRDAAGYCLAALSQLRSVLSQARTALSKEGEEGTKRQKYFLASKKCEFFQAWVLDNAHRIRMLAIELWHEHSKRECDRSSMEKAKTVVEENLKKGKSKLIEELS
ncbi:hypothetical protein D5F01_LYC21442 [Larimichthys crocea]|uniref:HIT-type domain-containing protein n=1 Tax=Larimichthys crocea TaxID=215358 RepID=A0A6G0HNV1_LARCR|nr:hypothetical protein D5F01_LYC21442 [Larimichthys crocea]